MASTIRIEFTERPPLDATLKLFTPNYLGLEGLETFKTQRITNKQSTLFNSGNLVNDLINIANAYAQAVQVDYNAGGVFNVDRAFNVVEIQTQDDNVFDTWSKSAGWDISVTVTNVPISEFLNITNVSYLEADSDVCNKVKVRVEANKPFTDVVLPVVQSQPSESFIEFDFDRSVNYELKIQNSLADADYQAPIFNLTPAFIDEVFITFQENATPNGVNLTVGYNGNLNNNSLTYSIDGTNFQTSPVFAGLLEGTYTISVKDQYGCVKATTYTIGNFEPGQNTAPPFFFYPLSNPINFAFNKEIDDCDNLNFDDLLSHSDKEGVLYKIPHLLKSCDVRTLQFRTSYNNTNIELLDCEGNLAIDVDVIKKTDNINVFDSRDAFKFSDAGGFVKLYFTTGNTYDENGQVLVPHFLNGNYPEAYKVGGYVRFDGTYELINSIEYNTEFERWEICTSETSLVQINPTSIIASIYYNVQPYDVYEATIDFNGLDEGLYQLNINSGYALETPNIMGLSEFIEVSEEISQNHIIEWGNSENNNIIYNTGYRGAMRLIYDSEPKYVPVDEIEQYQQEDNIIGLDNYNRNRWEFSFFMMSKKQTKQLNEILINDAIFIDNKEYIKVGTPETTRIGISNAYNVKVVLQEQFLNKYISEPYSTQNLSFVGIAYDGTLISSGGFLVDSNGLVSNG